MCGCYILFVFPLCYMHTSPSPFLTANVLLIQSVDLYSTIRKQEQDLQKWCLKYEKEEYIYLRSVFLLPALLACIYQLSFETTTARNLVFVFERKA